MIQRQRILIFILLGTILLGGGGYLAYSLLLGPAKGRAEQISKLQAEIKDRESRLKQVRANNLQLRRWKQQSLPSDVDLARREYEKYLDDILRRSGFVAGSFTVTPKAEDSKSSPKLGNKQPIYTKLDYTVTGRGPLESVVAMMRTFYSTGYLHQIKNISLQRSMTGATQQNRERLRDLDVTMTVEALVINGGDKRPFLAPVTRVSGAMDLLAAKQRGVGGLLLAIAAASPGGFTAPPRLAPSHRNYDSVAARNVFVGPPPPPPPVYDDSDPEALKQVYLTDITTNFLRTEAFLFDRLNNQRTRLRTSAAWSDFRVGDSEKPTVKGEVVKIDDQEREVIFKTAEKKYYSIRLGQSLADAMKKPLPEDKVKELTGAKTEADTKSTGQE